MQVYGACVATTAQEAEALKDFMFEQMGMKNTPSPEPIKEVYITIDEDGYITGVYSTYDEAEEDATQFEKVEKHRLPFIV